MKFQSSTFCIGLLTFQPYLALYLTYSHMTIAQLCLTIFNDQDRLSFFRWLYLLHPIQNLLIQYCNHLTFLIFSTIHLTLQIEFSYQYDNKIQLYISFESLDNHRIEVLINEIYLIIHRVCWALWKFSFFNLASPMARFFFAYFLEI